MNVGRGDGASFLLRTPYRSLLPVAVASALILAQYGGEPEMNAEKLAWLNSDETHGLAREVSLKYHLPVCLAPAVALLECGYGTSDLARHHHNEFGTVAWDRAQRQTKPAPGQKYGYVIWESRRDSWYQFGRDMRHSSLYDDARRRIELVALPDRECEVLWVKEIATIYCSDDPNWCREVLKTLREVWQAWDLKPPDRDPLAEHNWHADNNATCP